MVADWELIQERVISGKGVLKVPTDKEKNRSYILYSALIRPPKSPYKNFNYNPPRSRYGFLTFLRNDYVINTASVEFEQQSYDGVNDVSGQTLLALKCVNNAILQSIYNLSVALAATPGGTGLSPISFENVIKEYTNLRLAWNECRLVCYADTALSLRLYRLKYDVCNEEFDDDKPPPPPPPPPPRVPPETPVPNSYPYDPPNNDNSNSEPFEGDEPEPPTQGDVCTLYSVTVRYTNGEPSGYESPPITFDCKVWGKIGDISFSGQAGDYSYIFLKCQGVKEKPGGGAEIIAACGTFRDYRLGSNGYTYPVVFIKTCVIVSVTPIS